MWPLVVARLNGGWSDRHAELFPQRPQVGRDVLRILVAPIRVLGHHPREDGGQLVGDRPG